jgi:hypothetical protein
MAKFLVGRRYRRKLADGIRCRGVIACVCAAALGLAGSEHVMYSLGYTGEGLLSATVESAFRALFAFPLHVGTVRFVPATAPSLFGLALL